MQLVLPSTAGQRTAPDAGTLWPERVGRFEAAILRESLGATGGSIIETLKLLGIPRKTLYDKMARHGIDPKRCR